MADPFDAARMVEADSVHLKIALEARAPGILVVSEAYYPGWQATLDGNLTPCSRRLRLSRRGRRRRPDVTEMRFRRRPTEWGLALAGLGLVPSFASAVCGAGRTSSSTNMPDALIERLSLYFSDCRFSEASSCRLRRAADWARPRPMPAQGRTRTLFLAVATLASSMPPPVPRVKQAS